MNSSTNRLLLKQSLDLYNDSFRIDAIGETEAGSAGEQPARDSQSQNEWECWPALPFGTHFGYA